MQSVKFNAIWGHTRCQSFWLRFMPADLYKWEVELGTNNQDTHRLYRGEDIDGRDA